MAQVTAGGVVSTTWKVAEQEAVRPHGAVPAIEKLLKTKSKCGGHIDGNYSGSKQMFSKTETKTKSNLNTSQTRGNSRSYGDQGKNLPTQCTTRPLLAMLSSMETVPLVLTWHPTALAGHAHTTARGAPEQASTPCLFVLCKFVCEKIQNTPLQRRLRIWLDRTGRTRARCS